MAVDLQYQALPSLPRLFLRSSLRRRRGPSDPFRPQIPPMRAEVIGLRPDLDQIRRYREVCGFAPGSTLPIPYPHVLATPLHAAMVTHAKFPYGVLGIVHVRQTITLHGPIRQEERVSLHCRIEAEREGRRGLEFDLVTELRRGGDLMWEGITTALIRTRRKNPGPRQSDPTGHPTPSLPADQQVSKDIAVPEDMGRRYAHVTHDYNPIHLHALTARPFGFKAPIVHGMWSLARILAEFEAGLPPLPLRIVAEFKAPLELPTTARLRRGPNGDKQAFVLEPQGGGRPYLRGFIEPLARPR